MVYESGDEVEMWVVSACIYVTTLCSQYLMGIGQSVGLVDNRHW